VLAVVLAAVWGLAAVTLWQSQVPGGLDLPAVDVAEYVDEETLARADRYERFLRWEFVVSQLVLLAVLALYARYGIRFARESAAGRIGTGMLLGMLGFALVWLSQVPFRLVAVWWRRRYDQTDSGYLETLFANWVALGAEFLFISFALAVVMALAGRFPRNWWLGAAPVFVALGALFAFIFPYLSSTDPLEDERLARDAVAYAEEQGVDPIPVRVEDVTDFTKAPNAYAAGFGPTERIVFWNTLLDGRFSDGEVRVVLAHEVAHHSRSHIPKGIAWYALFALPGAWLIALATRRRGGMANPEAVPLSLLVLVALNLASLPLYNAISRHMEKEADWVAHETVEDPDAAAELFANFTIESLSDPDPPTWAYLLFDSHPSVEERIAMARAWEERRPR
jgi:STE24 endopeptidase